MIICGKANWGGMLAVGEAMAALAPVPQPKGRLAKKKRKGDGLEGVVAE
jgi:hypothetical protein